MNTTRSMVAGLLALAGAGCAYQDGGTRESALLADLDPALAGLATWEDWIALPGVQLVGDPAPRATWRAQRAEDLATAARAAAARHFDEPLRTAAIEFWRSDAGQALRRAELFAMRAEIPLPDDFPRRMVELCGSPDRVGERAAAAMSAAQADLAAGGSPSPTRLAEQLGALSVDAEQARAIAAFATSESGPAWIEARCRAFPAGHRRLLDAIRAARQAGYLRTPADDLEEVLPDLVLPDLLFPDDLESEPVKGR